jgi:hypothetical protein
LLLFTFACTVSDYFIAQPTYIYELFVNIHIYYSVNKILYDLFDLSFSDDKSIPLLYTLESTEAYKHAAYRPPAVPIGPRPRPIPGLPLRWPPRLL